MSVKVNNVAKYAESKRYIVARGLDGELWFWGAWDDEAKAKQAAAEIGGVVVSTECLDKNDQRELCRRSKDEAA